jgi:peptidoglycan/LPS O-acetylase OafA/YrhL
MSSIKLHPSDTKVTSYYSPLLADYSTSVLFSWLLPASSNPSASAATIDYTKRMDILRFVAICSIIWGHCLFGWEAIMPKNMVYHIALSIITELGRVGTVIFFIISGFFLGNNIHKYTLLSYLRHRLFSIIVPWVCFLTLFVLIQIAHLRSMHQIITDSPVKTLLLFYNIFKGFVFHAAYWFIPISMIAACALVVLKNYMNKSWLGIIFLSATLFYGVNLHYGWISANHTKAFAGYIFFMWLGLQLKMHMHQVTQLIEKLSWPVLLHALLLLLAIACWESVQLQHTGSVDPYASIRISNWLLSIGVFIALLKSDKLTWVSYLKPQRYVYGVYLVHCIIITELTPLISIYVARIHMHSIREVFTMQCVVFSIILALSYCAVSLVRKSPLRFILGSK